MIHHNLLLILSLLFAVFLLIMLGQKLRVSYPILLVLGGLAISLVPGMPRITIDPEMVFLLFLPPILYEAAWFTSWYDFWKMRRPISLLAFGLVVFTSAAVAFVSTALIPGFTLALGFLLGGIISPPDAVAATSVLKTVKVPRRALTILEGESLVNDASSLIVFRFALAAVITGQFVIQKAVGDFFLVAGMGILVGVAVAHIFYFIHRYLPTTPSMDTALTLMTPYIMYIAAEEFHYSGVMAVVSGGLFLSFRSHDFLNHNSRVQSTNVWNTVIFVLNGLIFILIGLQLPVITEGLGENSIGEAILYGVIISLLVILIRIIWVFPGTYLPRFLSKRIRDREPNPGWRSVFLVSWAGMRGVVSLAAALSVPLMLGDQAFPQRNLILFISFTVILFTLVIQGLSLPLLIRLLKIRDAEERMPAEDQAAAIRMRVMRASLAYMQTNYAADIAANQWLSTLKQQYENEATLIAQRLEEDMDCDDCEREFRRMYNKVLAEMIAIQRRELVSIRREQLFDDEVIRRHEMNLDIEAIRVSG